MTVQNMKLKFIIMLVLFQNTGEHRFMRRLEAVGYPYYKIVMALGICKETVLFTDQKIWGKVPLNRVLDIYYKSNNPDVTVSRVEIVLIINSTNTIAFSEDGVGHRDFYGTLYLPLNIGFIIYHLIVFTCSRNFEHLSSEESEIENNDKYMPFYYTKNRKQ